MNRLYFKDVPFPHVQFELIDSSETSIVTSTSDNQCTFLMPIFSTMGPDDRTLLITSLSQLTALYGTPTYKKYGLTLKSAVRALTYGGKVLVRRLTDPSAYNANAVLNVHVNAADETKKVYFYPKDNKFLAEAPAGKVKDTDYFEIPLPTTPGLSYSATSAEEIKSETDAKLITISEGASAYTVPLYVLMRTGAGTNGNKTECTISTIKTVSSNYDNIFSMTLDYGSTAENYKVNAVIDSRYDTTPLNIEAVLNNSSIQTNVVSSESNQDILETKIIELLEAYATDVEASVSLVSNESAKAKLTDLKDAIIAMKEMVEDGDIEATSLLTIFGENTRFPLMNAISGDAIETIKFAHGTNGELLQGAFDWNKTATIDGSEVKIYQSLMTEFFTGVTDPAVYDINLTPADVIVDAEYPVELKKVVSTFVSAPNRNDIEFVMGSTNVASTIELKSLDEGLKVDNYGVLKMLGYADTYDNSELKTLTLPTTYFIIKNICEFFTDGWCDPPLSGRFVEGPISNTLLPVFNASNLEEEKTYAVNNGWNYLSYTKYGYQIDGQKTASTDATVVSILQEFHNQAIVSRIIKKLYDACARNKHFIQKAANVTSFVAVVNKELEEFLPKVGSLSYSAYYADEFEEAEGLLTDYINISMYGTNKSHKIILNVARHSLSE